eukprot:3946291-Heterocapsa_arctica.AAC.1
MASGVICAEMLSHRAFAVPPNRKVRATDIALQAFPGVSSGAHAATRTVDPAERRARGTRVRRCSMSRVLAACSHPPKSSCPIETANAIYGIDSSAGRSGRCS